jgi:hypothetical protein
LNKVKQATAIYFSNYYFFVVIVWLTAYSLELVAKKQSHITPITKIASFMPSFSF